MDRIQLRDNQSGMEVEQFSQLEEQLRRTYGQVKPAPEFIETLQRRLITPPEVILENRRNGLVFLILVGGLVGGVILFVLIRALYGLFVADDEPSEA